MAIDRFRGPHRFLSNFWYVNVMMYDLVYPTVEHAYQAAKTTNPEERERIRNAQGPAAAKRLGREVTLRPDWEDFKFFAMKTLLQRKFYIPALRIMLNDTGDEELIEGNTWHDMIWGVCYCRTHDGLGENHLGRMLMEVRDENRVQ